MVSALKRLKPPVLLPIDDEPFELPLLLPLELRDRLSEESIGPAWSGLAVMRLITLVKSKWPRLLTWFCERNNTTEYGESIL